MAHADALRGPARKPGAHKFADLLDRAAVFEHCRLGQADARWSEQREQAPVIRFGTEGSGQDARHQGISDEQESDFEHASAQTDEARWIDCPCVAQR